MTKTFTIALLACAICGSSMSVSASAEQDKKEKDKTFSQPAEQQPVIMPAGQRPEEWKFEKEKEAEAKKAVEDEKAAKKKAEEDKKAAAEAKRKTEADRRLANKLAKEDGAKKREEERRAAADKKKADETQRAADARAEREAAASKRAEEQKAADERRALERRAAAEKAAEDRKAEAEKAAEEVRLKEARERDERQAREAAKKSAGQKRASSSERKDTPPVAAASDPAPAPASSSASAPAKAPASSGTSSARAGSSASASERSASASAPAAASSSSSQQPASGQATGGQTQTEGGKSTVDPKRPPAVIRAGEQPDEWKMQSEKPRAEGSAEQAQKGKSSGSNSPEAKSASANPGAGQSKPSAPPKPKEPWRGWSDRALISLNGGWQSASFDLRHTRSFDPSIPGDSEQRTLSADYSVKSGTSLDLGGGYRLWRALAAGVSVTRFSDSGDVSVSGTVPHPFFFNRSRSIEGVTSGVREETAVHVDAMWVMPIRPKMTLALFGGPSFYSVKQTVVTDYDYTQSYPYDEVTLTSLITGEESSSVTGVNFGADVGYYFTETIGVGGVIRFSRASVDTSIGSLDVGGPEFGLGLRIRIPQGRPRPIR